MSDASNKVKRSNGVRRLFHVISAACALVVGCWLAIDLEGFSYGAPEAIISILSIGAAYLVPQIILKVSYWVIDGFKGESKPPAAP